MHIFIPGGAGYVGSLLVPALIETGHEVTVYDLFLQGEVLFKPIKDHPKLTLVKGDVRDLKLMEVALNGCETILHLACSLENLETASFESFVQIAKKKPLTALFSPLLLLFMEMQKIAQRKLLPIPFLPMLSTKVPVKNLNGT